MLTDYALELLRRHDERVAKEREEDRKRKEARGTPDPKSFNETCELFQEIEKEKLTRGNSGLADPVYIQDIINFNNNLITF